MHHHGLATQSFVALLFGTEPFYVGGINADNYSQMKKSVWGAWIVYFFTFVGCSAAIFMRPKIDPNAVEGYEVSLYSQLGTYL